DSAPTWSGPVYPCPLRNSAPRNIFAASLSVTNLENMQDLAGRPANFLGSYRRVKSGCGWIDQKPAKGNIGGIDMMVRFLLIGLLAAIASANPLTLTFTGTADGKLGDVIFTQKLFTLIFTSDTALLVRPSEIPVDWSTPAGTFGTFFIVGVGGGTFMDDQAVF